MELHFHKLADMLEQKCKTGNRTICQTPAVMRQAAYERKQSDLLHQHPFVEVDIAKECWQTAMPADHASSYDQQLGSEPFRVVVYCQQHVQLQVDSCKAGNATLHVDATGCVVCNIRRQKRALFYSIVLGDGSIPVFDAVTTRHTSLDLDLDNNCQTPSDICGNGVDVSYGRSDITEVVSWLLNEDTEAADVMALGREFHSGIVLGVKDF